ncbi:MAG: cobalamin biosynthesis protein CbiX [Verrucomicrobia bacterium]|nr:cobalamin biosynthesis protein CbiX [Verrucomicrobiota bacterium]
MGQDHYSDAALVLVGHGSTQSLESGAPVTQHAAALRRRQLFAEVREAFWKQAPQLSGVLSSLTAPRLFIVPIFISEGFFSDRVIPGALGLRLEGQADYSRVQRRGPQTLFYCRPVGTHEGMTGILLARAREVLERFPFPRPPDPKETTLFIAGHGTEQDENSRRTVTRHVEMIRALDLYAAVHAVFIEEAPRIGECYQIARTRNIVVVPLFIGDGPHVREDIPVLLGAPKPAVEQRLASGQPGWRNPTEAQGKRVWYASSVGGDPGVAEVILERVREAEDGT